MIPLNTWRPLPRSGLNGVAKTRGLMDYHHILVYQPPVNRGRSDLNLGSRIISLGDAFGSRRATTHYMIVRDPE